MAIRRERFELALDQLGPTDGHSFERFANAFLAVEMPELRPVGGMHDQGQDAYIYNCHSLPGAFVQHSTTPDWRAKIRATLKTLRGAGMAVTHLTYTTPRLIGSKIDSLRIELRSEGVMLDVRDREYFLTHVGTLPARGEAAELLAKQYVDPLLADRGVLGHVAMALTDEEERVAATYLQLEVGAKDPAKAVTKSVLEAIVMYSLREATPDSLVPRRDIHETAKRFTSASERQRVCALIDGTLRRLVDRDLVKHHRREDAFTLALGQRAEMTARLERLLAERAEVHAEVEDRTDAVAARLGVDFRYDSSKVASDVLAVADRLLCAGGRIAALALVGLGEFHAKRESTIMAAEQVIQQAPEQLLSLGELGATNFVDLIPAVVEDILARPSEAIARRLRRATDAYCLLFALRETADVQGAIDKIFRGSRIQVDTSVLLPCLAEQLLPPKNRRMSNLLRAATASGFSLFVGEDVLNELQTHLERVLVGFRRHTSSAVNAVGGAAAAVYQPLLISTYLTAGTPGSFEDVVARFMGEQDPQRDLAEFLRFELSVDFDEMAEVRRRLDPGTLEELVTQWRLVKRRRPWMDEEAFATLVRHDARAFLLIEHLRKNEGPSEQYGYTWWWLTMDGAAYRTDHLRRGNRAVSLCMSPEFFARYLSVAPKRSRQEQIAADLLPISIEVAGLGLVPPELRDEAGRLYESNKDLPEYLRRRRLRELVNRAYATRDEAGAVAEED